VDCEKISGEIYDGFMGNLLNRSEFVKAYDDLYEEIPPNARSHLARRKDKRTLGEFALSIWDNSRREKILIELWAESCKKKGIFNQFEFSANGVDNSGRLYIGYRRNASNSDFIVTIDDKTGPLEVKFNPSKVKNTFKLADLKNYIKEGALVLVIMGAKMLGPNGDCKKPSLRPELVDLKGMSWFVITPSSMAQLLELPIKNLWEIGNKPGIQILERDFSKYFDIYEF
jgi:hypothetical protein